MTNRPRFRRFIGIIAALSTQAAYPVIISEISTTSNEQVFARNAQGIATLGGGTQWWETGYNDNFWSNGFTPIGFGSGYTDIITNVENEVRNKTPTLYLRQTFNLTAGEAASIQTLTLRMDYDDSFIAYLNGREVARADAGARGLPHYPSQESLNANSADGTGSTFSLGAANLSLQTGENILAIEIHNSSAASTTLKAKPTLFTPAKTYLTPGDPCIWFPGMIMPSGGVFDPAFVNPLTILQTAWASPEFDDSTWSTGLGPIGSESSANNPYALGTNLVSDFKSKALSIYLRHTFELTANDLAELENLVLDYDYDDGCLIFLNGSELVRGNLGTPGEFVAFDTPPSGSHGASTDNGGTYNPDQFSVPKTRLRVGTNVLSAQIHNVNQSNSDLIMSLVLRSTGANPTTLVASDALYSYFIGFSEPTLVPAKSLTTELEFSDWIELTNDQATSIDLSGWGLSDDASNPAKFKIPGGTILPPGSQLLILADDQEEFNGFGDRLHASFKLSAFGEDVLLTNPAGTVVSSVLGYPAQYARQSYGYDQTGMVWGYYAHPTPGTPNRAMTLADRVDSPDFSPVGGFYNSTQTLTLTSSTPGAAIRYTLDGSEPTDTNGANYTTPLNVSALNDKTGRVIRARAFKAGLLPSKPKTHTYLIAQNTALRTAPALIFSGDENENFYKNHGIMAINGGVYTNGQWVQNGPNTYNIPINQGSEFERPIFVEFYHPDNAIRFREDAGIRISSSGFSRPRLILNNTGASPWTNTPEQKPSFNLYFRDEYGSPKLESPWLGSDYPVNDFEQLRIRAGKNDIGNPFIVDELVRRLFGEMGQASSHGIINTLYINGKYKGFFNMCERLREPFMQKHHGGSREWDVRQVNDYPNGDVAAWNQMMIILNRSGAGDLSLADWQEALGYLEPVNMADYFLLNIYGATWDWPQNNWVGARERSLQGRYRLYVWDAEGAFYNQSYFNQVNHDTFSSDLLAKSDTLSALFKRLIKSPEWRITFADRIQKHLFHNGALDDRAGLNSRFGAHLISLRDHYQPLFQYQFGGSINLSFFNQWTSASSGRRTYLLGPNRTDFASNGLWPSVTPPAFSQHGGDPGIATPVSISAQGDARIYFTTDGSDPREPGGAIQPGLSPYTSPLTFNPGRTLLKARSLSGGTWSALTEAEFAVELALPSTSNLVISEFLYHPADVSASEAAAGFSNQDDFEFLELLNTSATDTIDLANLSFTAGINFFFSGSALTELPPGQRVLIVANRAAFEFRYGSDRLVAGQYSATLANSGELITLSLGATPLITFTYDDLAPWPACADGPGFSLVLLNPQSTPDPNLPANWTCSTHFSGDLGGNPIPYNFGTWTDFNFSALQLQSPALSGPNADPDQDGMTNFMEFALGSNPLTPDSLKNHPHLSTTRIGGIDYPVLTFARNGSGSNLLYHLTSTTTLQANDWSDIAPGSILPSPPVRLADGRIRESWLINLPLSDIPKRFFRIKMLTQKS